MTTSLKIPRQVAPRAHSAPISFITPRKMLMPIDGKFQFVIEQGDFIHRPSRINIEVTGELGTVEQVRVGGPSVIVARGEVFV